MNALLQRAARAGRWTLTHWALIPILAVAAWLRFSTLGSEHLFGDEAEYAIVARYLSRDAFDLFYPALSSPPDRVFVSQPPLLLYLMAASMRVLGPSDFAAVLPIGLLGIATAAVAYALGWRLGGRVHATLAGALVAVLPFHVSMSRGAMLDVGYAFFLLLAAYFLVAWLQERRARQAVGAGAAAAAATLSKLPGVLIVPVLLVVLLVVAVPLLVRHARRLAPREETVAEAKRLAGHAALALAPLALGAFLYLGLLWHLDGMEDLREKLVWNVDRVASGEGGSAKPVSYYFDDPRSSFRAQLGGGVFALALVGLAFEAARAALRPVRRPERVVLPVLTLALAAFFLGSDRKIGFYLLPFAPLAAVLVGSAVAGVGDLVSWAGIRFTRRDVRRFAPLATAVAAVVAAMPAYAALSDSYQEYGSGRDGSTFGYGFREAAEWIDEEDPEAGQYGTLLGRFTLRWYNDHATYHQFAGEERLDRAVEEGRLRYLVYDEYIGKGEDTLTVERLKMLWGGEPVARFERGWGWVEVYRLSPHPTMP